jgi:hypothetical protein
MTQSEERLISSVQSLDSSTKTEIASLSRELSCLKTLLEEQSKLGSPVLQKEIFCEFRCDRPLEGIISTLMKQCGGNVSEMNIVAVNSSSVAENLNCEGVEGIDFRVKSITDFESKTFFKSENLPNQWICYEFKRHYVICTNYSIRTHPRCEMIGRHHPRSWVFEGSSDGQTWIILGGEQDNPSLDRSDICRSFPVVDQVMVRAIRLRQTGANHGGDYCLALSALEIFGCVIEC